MAFLFVSFHSYERKQNADRLETLLCFELMGYLSPSQESSCYVTTYTYTYLLTGREFLLYHAPLTQKLSSSQLLASYVQKEILASPPLWWDWVGFHWTRSMN
jgi:hypothetical protein